MIRSIPARARAMLAMTVLATAAACSDSLVGRAPAQDRASLFDDLWQQFDLRYSYFELKHIDWTAIGDRYRPLALAAPNDTAFAVVLSHMLAELHDVHVSITPFGPSSTMRWVSPYDTAASGFDAGVVYSRYATTSFPTSGGHMRAGIVEPGVGYIQIPSFAGSGWAGEIDEAITRLGDVSSLIIDIRNNGGGNKGLATSIAGRFADRERTYGYVRLRNGSKHTDFTGDIAETVAPEGARRFSGRVVVLANRRCYSSAENFVLAMRTIPSVTVVGDTTGGASGGPLVRELANGWTYQLSQWVEYTPDHRTYEGVGLAPDIVAKAVAVKGKLVGTGDVALDRALVVARIQ